MPRIGDEVYAISRYLVNSDMKTQRADVARGFVVSTDGETVCLTSTRTFAELSFRPAAEVYGSRESALEAARHIALALRAEGCEVVVSEGGVEVPSD